MIPSLKTEDLIVSGLLGGINVYSGMDGVAKSWIWEGATHALQ